MSDFVAFGASVVGGAIVAASTLGGLAIRQRGDADRSRIADRQHLRDVKADRLRRVYEPLVAFVLMLQQVVNEKRYAKEGEDIPTRDARHERALGDGMRRVSEVIAAVIMEPETESVKAAFDQAYFASDRYLRSLNMNTKIAGSISGDTVAMEFSKVGASANDLLAAVRAQLQKLEEPIV